MVAMLPNGQIKLLGNDSVNGEEFLRGLMLPVSLVLRTTSNLYQK